MGSLFRWRFAVVALLAASVLPYLAYEYRADLQGHRQSLQERGDTILEALSAGIRTQTQRGRYRAERLSAIFEALRSAPGVLGMTLTDASGQTIASGGVPITAPLPSQEYKWTDQGLVMQRTVEPLRPEGPPGGPGRGGRGWGDPRRGGDGPHDGGRNRPDFRDGPPPPPKHPPPGEPGNGNGPDAGASEVSDGPPPREPETHGGKFPFGPFGRGRHGPPPEEEGWVPWAPGALTLTLALDTVPLAQLKQRATLKYLLSSLVAVGLLALAVMVQGAAARQRQLQTDLRMAEERAAHHERLARLGAGLAHETKNPLGLVRGLAQSVSDQSNLSDEVRQHTRQIIDETDRVVGQLNGFLTFASPKEPDLAPVPLDGFFKELLPLVQQDADARGVNVAYSATNITVEADAELLRRAVLNLLINAVAACSTGGQIRVVADLSEFGVTLSVCDTGAGIAPEDLEHVREPYFTRFPRGTGLGLPLVEEICRAHGWRLDISSRLGEGTEVSLRSLRAVG